MSTIRRQISIEAAPRAVWAALTTPAGLTGWLCDAARMDARAGGRVVLTLEGDDDAPIEESGILHTCRPTSKLEITWDKVSPGPWKGTATTFSVARDGEETVVNLQHSGPAFTDAKVREEVDTFWRRALNALRDSLE